MTARQAAKIGFLLGIAFVLLVVGVLWFVHRDEYLCFTWGRHNEVVKCRVH